MFKSRYFIPIRAKNYEILLLYGDKLEQFEDVMMKSNDDGETDM
jgi:predicted secreted acid phosphatase